MGFWKTLFGGTEESPAEEKKNAEARNFDLLKYDGVKAMRIGQFDYAVKCFREALKIQEDLEVRDYLQQALARNGQIPEAIRELEVMSKAQPDNAQLLLHMARLAFMEEDYELMATVCQKAEELDADNALVHYLYAQACIGQGDMIGGIARLTKAIALDEEMLDARLLRGQTLLKMGELKGAQEDVDYLLAHTESHEDVLLLAARLAHASGNDDLAIDIYGQVIDVNPFQIDAYRERGKLRFDAGDKHGAEEDMQKVLELNPQEMANVSGDYSAEGIEQRVRQAYSNLNPFGI